jgi:hypothetical protein
MLESLRGRPQAIQPHAASGAREAFVKTHHPWWPHLHVEPIFNPFVSILERRPPSEWIDLPEIEEEEDEPAMKSPDTRSHADK